MFPKQFANFAEDLYNMELRPDDVWVVTYPKCGTTWTQEMVWQIVHGVDLEQGGRVNLNLRFPYVDWQMFLDPATKFPPAIQADPLQAF